jgi:hypothetical protein
VCAKIQEAIKVLKNMRTLTCNPARTTAKTHVTLFLSVLKRIPVKPTLAANWAATQDKTIGILMKNWIHLLLQEVTKSLTTSSTVNISGTTKISLASSFGIAPMLNGV